MATVIDYAWSGPSPQQIKQAGHEGVMRYISHDGSKDLSPRERDGLRALDLTIGLVFEFTANRAAQGFAAGTADAQYANQRANTLGYPLWCTLWYGVDFDASAAQVQPYFDGIRSIPGRPYAPYGGIKIIDGVVYPAIPWQTVAWSGGRVSARAGLLQNKFANAYDINQVLKADYGQWTTQPAPPPPQEERVYYFFKYKTSAANWNMLGSCKAWVRDENTRQDISQGKFQVIELEDGAALLQCPVVGPLPPESDWPYDR